MNYEPPREPMSDRQFWGVFAALVVGLLIGGAIIAAADWAWTIYARAQP